MMQLYTRIILVYLYQQNLKNNKNSLPTIITMHIMKWNILSELTHAITQECPWSTTQFGALLLAASTLEKLSTLRRVSVVVHTLIKTSLLKKSLHCRSYW